MWKFENQHSSVEKSQPSKLLYTIGKSICEEIYQFWICLILSKTKELILLRTFVYFSQIYSSDQTSLTADIALASEDIKNIVKSLTDLSKIYAEHCNIIANDRDSDIVVRNAILLLTTLNFNSITPTSIMLHIWYSALIFAQMLRFFQNNVLSLIQNVCNKIRMKLIKSLLSKTWTYDTQSLRLILTKEQWNNFLFYFEVFSGLSMIHVQIVCAFTTLAPKRKDYVERALFIQSPAWRVCIMKFREDGILLSFRSFRKEFDTSNS